MGYFVCRCDSKDWFGCDEWGSNNGRNVTQVRGPDPRGQGSVRKVQMRWAIINVYSACPNRIEDQSQAFNLFMPVLPKYGQQFWLQKLHQISFKRLTHSYQYCPKICKHFVRDRPINRTYRLIAHSTSDFDDRLQFYKIDYFLSFFEIINCI